MVFWNRQQFDSNDEEMQKLEQQLRDVSKIQLPMKQQQALKRQLFSELKNQTSVQKNIVSTKENAIHPQEKQEFLPQSLRILGSQISEVGQQTSLSIPERVAMKERVFAFIQKSHWLGLSFSPFKSARFWKVAMSSAMLLFFVVTSVLIFPFQVPLTYAARLTYIDDLSGQVFVLRGGQLLAAKKDFALVEGDVLITKDKSFVTVRFFDDSVSRLDANTQLEVNRLYSEPFNPVATQVELTLQDGHIWTRVLNLIDDDSHFMISTEDTAAIVTKKAAFDLQTHIYNTTLSVFDNVVDFGMGNNFTSATRPVLAGFQAQVLQENGSNVTKIVPVPQNLQANMNSQWVQSNLQKDEVHTQVLVQENEQDIEDNSDNMTDVLQTADSDTSKPLSNPDIEQQRLHFLDEYSRLLLGETYLMRQQGREGMQLVFEFEATVRSIMLRYADFQKTDPLNANLLLSLIESKVAEQRKNLATLLPGDSLYPVKQELDNTQLYLASSDVDKAKMQLSQSEDKLLEIQDLVAKGNFDEAKLVLVRYQTQLDSLVLKVNVDNASELQDKLVSLFDQQIEQIKVLTSIEKSIYTNQPELLESVRTLRQELLEKLMGAMEKINGDLPLDLIQELRDLLQTYLVNGAYDDSFVSMLNKMLVKYSKNSTTDGRLPAQLGVLTLVEEDATPPVQSQETQVSNVKSLLIPSRVGSKNGGLVLPSSQQQTEAKDQQNHTDACSGSQQCQHGLN